MDSFRSSTEAGDHNLSGSDTVNSQPLKVVWLCNYPPELLQPELNLVRPSKAHPSSWVVVLANALAERRDADLHLITATSGIVRDQTISKKGITFHLIRHTFPFTVRGFPDYMRLDLFTRYAQLSGRVKRLLWIIRPDIIHLHGTENGYGVALLNANAPAIVSIQGIINVLAEVAPSLFYRLQSRIELAVLRNIKNVATRTAWAAEFVRKVNSAATVYDLPEAIHPLFFKETPRQDKQPGREADYRILMVGSIVPRKGIEDALRAMSIVVAEIPSTKLVVVGSGSTQYLRELKRIATVAGIERKVEWLGHRKVDEIAELHKTSTILIHPSHLDNSPNSVAEAMVSGLPVIASRVGGIPSMIESDATGLLTDRGDHSQLAEKILWMLRNKAEREQLANRARKVALERHFPPLVAEKTLAVYKQIIASAQPNFLHGRHDSQLYGERPSPLVTADEQG
jgi:glycosyltransferase involved in cell wall biosynthesis